MSNVSLRLLVIKTHKVESVRVFYETIGLRFENEQHGNGPEHYSSSLDDGIFEIYPLLTNQDVDSNLRLGFAVADVDSVIRSLDLSSERLVQSPKETPWGFQAIVCDPDGRKVELYRAA